MSPMEGIDDRIIIDQKYLDMSFEEVERLYEAVRTSPKGTPLEKVEETLKNQPQI